jgi:quercetin dioxygenase-like cupin family protein
MKSRTLIVAVTLIVMAGAGVAWAQVGMKSTALLQTTTTATGQPILFPPSRSQFTGVVIELAPGGEVGRHMHPVPNFVFVLEGDLTIESEGQAARTYTAGQSFAESVNTWHNGINRSAAPAKFIVVFAGEEGKAVTVRP